MVDKTAGSVSFPKSSFAPCVPGGRLSLVTGTPVMTSAQLAKTTLYYALLNHRFVPVYNGTGLSSVDIGGELSLALDSNSGHTGYHQSGKNFDVFYAYVSGSTYFGTGPAWTNDTTRSAALAYFQGMLTNSGTMTLRHGSSSGHTVSVPANQATYLGTVRMSADGQTQFVLGGAAAGGTAGQLLVWNMYNRVLCAALVQDSTSSWTYNSSTYRNSNNSATMRVSFVVGMPGEPIQASFTEVLSASGNGTAVDTLGEIGIGLDSSTTPSGSPAYPVSQPATQAISAVVSANWAGQSGIGFHYLQAIEKSFFANTVTFYGSANAQNSLIVGVWT